MKSIPVPDPETRKKIMFYDTPTRQAQLRIKCRHDGLKQSEFFRLMIEGYLNDDPQITSYLHQCKERYNIQGKRKRNKINKMKADGQNKLKDFGLVDSDIENIFDILENDV